MLQFEFRLERPQPFIITGNSVFEKILNDEWKIEFTWNPVPAHTPQYLKICRQTTSEEMLVTGTLTHRARRTLISIDEFSKLIKPGSSYILMDLMELPVNYDSRTVDGVVYIVSTSNFANGECKKCTTGTSLKKLSNDFEKLLDPQNSCYSDVNLKCGDELIPAHKIILSTRSPVFAAMFANEMQENTERQVNITDMDVSVVRAMLTFIYTGKTSTFTISSASHLLYASEKYQLEDLKRVCTDFLKKSISLQNVLTIIDLGHALSEDLKYFAMDYFCNMCTNFFDFERSEEWKTFKIQRADLAMDLMASLLKFRDQQGPHVA